MLTRQLSLFSTHQNGNPKLAASAFNYCDWMKFSQRAYELGFVMSEKEPLFNDMLSYVHWAHNANKKRIFFEIYLAIR